MTSLTTSWTFKKTTIFLDTTTTMTALEPSIWLMATWCQTTSPEMNRTTTITINTTTTTDIRAIINKTRPLPVTKSLPLLAQTPTLIKRLIEFMDLSNTTMTLLLNLNIQLNMKTMASLNTARRSARRARVKSDLKARRKMMKNSWPLSIPNTSLMSFMIPRSLKPRKRRSWSRLETELLLKLPEIRRRLIWTNLKMPRTRLSLKTSNWSKRTEDSMKVGQRWKTRSSPLREKLNTWRWMAQAKIPLLPISLVCTVVKRKSKTKTSSPASETNPLKTALAHMIAPSQALFWPDAALRVAAIRDSISLCLPLLPLSWESSPSTSMVVPLKMDLFPLSNFQDSKLTSCCKTLLRTLKTKKKFKTLIICFQMTRQMRIYWIMNLIWTLSLLQILLLETSGHLNMEENISLKLPTVTERRFSTCFEFEKKNSFEEESMKLVWKG